MFLNGARESGRDFGLGQGEGRKEGQPWLTAGESDSDVCDATRTTSWLRESGLLSHVPGPFVRKGRSLANDTNFWAGGMMHTKTKIKRPFSCAPKIELLLFFEMVPPRPPAHM